MLRPLFILLLIVCFQSGHCQQVLAQIDVDANYVTRVQAFEVGDRIFLSFKDRRISKYFWIDRSGDTQPADLNPGPPDALLAAHERHEHIDHFYALAGSNATVLYTSQQDSNTGESIAGPEQCYTFGNAFLLGMVTTNNGLVFISYSKKTDKLDFVTIRHGKHIKTVSVGMTNEFKHLSSSGYIEDGNLAKIHAGAAATKIFWEDGRIVLTIDEDPYNGQKATRIIKVDPATGEHSLNLVPHRRDQEKFSSFYHNGKLFRFSLSLTYFQWWIFNAENGELLYYKKVEKDKSLRDIKVFRRNPELEVEYTSLFDMMVKAGEPSILVEGVADSDFVRVVVGTFNNTVVRPLSIEEAAETKAVNPMRTQLILNVANQLESRPGPSTYFYLRGNVERGLEIEKVEPAATHSIRQVIDEYEISRTSAVPKGEEKWSWWLGYKGYLETADGAIGIYHETRKDQKRITLIKYIVPSQE